MRTTASASGSEFPRLIHDLEIQMREAADNLQFELAAALRDKINEIRQMTLQKKS